MNHKRLDHVLTELASYTGIKKPAGSDSTFVLCPFHGERTPSFRIFHSASSGSPGYGKCYGCGEKQPWDVFAPKLGLKPYEKSKPSVAYARPVVRPLQEDENVDHVFRHTPLPEGKKWRGISTLLLKKVGASLVEQYGTKFVYLPVLINREERGYVRARLRKEADKPSYLNKPGKWSEKYGLFGFDYAVKIMRSLKIKTLVLVEGPRDALRLLSLGIPAIAILGTQSWTRTKSIILDLSGADKIILCFDGDCAGKNAVEYIRPQLKRMFTTEVFDLCDEDSPYWAFRNRAEPSKSAKRKGVELWDPGNMPVFKVNQLRQAVLAAQTQAKPKL
jgi:5S rRNA maturation endonuclease (ribonuclease M5)